MLSAILQAIQALLVLLFVIAFGFWLSRKGLFENPLSRGLVSKIVNASLPFFLFHSVISKFGYEQFLELLKYAGLPFLTVFINFLFSVFFIKIGWVRKEIHGTFIAAFSAATVLFVGVPLVVSMFGSDGVPYLLVYFFANCVFIWTVGLYQIQLDGSIRGNLPQPKFISVSGLKRLFSPPLMGFIIGLIVVLTQIPIPRFVEMSTKYIGQITTPLALIFVGITVYYIGFDKLRHLPREIWLILFSCFVLRPVVMYFCTMPLEMDLLMRKCFILASALPVSSVIAVLAKAHGADEEFASEAIGASTVAMIPVLPILLITVNLIH